MKEGYEKSPNRVLFFLFVLCCCLSWSSLALEEVSFPFCYLNVDKMDKLTIISGTLFMAADVFAIVSLAMPDWIITDVGGTSNLLVAFSLIGLESG